MVRQSVFKSFTWNSKTCIFCLFSPSWWQLTASFIGSYAAVGVSRSRAWDILQRHYAVGSQHQCLKHHTIGTQENFTSYRRHSKKFLVNATAGHPLESEPGAYNPKSIWTTVKNATDAFYRFSRPHTVIGTVKFLTVASSYLVLFQLFIYLFFFYSVTPKIDTWDLVVNGIT